MSKDKGDRRERQAKEALESNRYRAETPNATKFQRLDFFGLFDIIAIHPEQKPILIQVKSNSARGIRDFSEKSDKIIPQKYFHVHYWVCHDREGWRVIDVVSGDTEVLFDGRDKKGNMLDNLEKFLEEFSRNPSNGDSESN